MNSGKNLVGTLGLIATIVGLTTSGALAVSEMAPPISLAAATPAATTPEPAATSQPASESKTTDVTKKEKEAAKPVCKSTVCPPVAPETPQPTDPIQAAIWKAKNPIPGVRWGADYRIRDEYMNNARRFDHGGVNNEDDWLRHRPRFWTTFSLGDFLDFNMRMMWEGRNIFQPKSAVNMDWGEVLFDVMNFAIRKPDGLPITIIAGRQDITLGDKWLVLDGTPLDGSRTMYFDAIRLNLDLERIKTKIDAIYIEQNAKSENWIHMIKTRDKNMFTGAPAQRYVTEQNERGAIVWVENKSLKNTEIDGYYIYKGDHAVAPNSQNADIHTFGQRIAYEFDEHWRARAEVAEQFGRRGANNLCALGSLNRLAYYFNDPHNNWLRMDYEYMSGDRPGTGTDEGFDPLWGRFPRISEMLYYTSAWEKRTGDLSNLHRVAWGWSVNLLPQLEMLTDYHLMFTDQNTYRDRPQFTDSGCFRGQLLSWWLKYVISPQLSGHIVAEFFFPGDYYSKSNNDVATFLRGELLFAF